jgi:hypothetical protein
MQEPPHEREAPGRRGGVDRLPLCRLADLHQNLPLDLPLGWKVEDGPMEVVLLSEGCPSWQLTDARLREAFRALGAATMPVTCRHVDNPDDAERLGFRGVPAIRGSGRDHCACPGDRVGLACRRYPGAGGDHSPAVQRIQAVAGAG